MSDLPPYDRDADGLLDWMQANDVAVTRENYQRLAWGWAPPDGWLPEHEALLPPELRRPTEPDPDNLPSGLRYVD